MMKYVVFLFLFLAMILKAEYIAGDHIPDMHYVDTNIDSLDRVVYSNQSIKDIISSGKVIVISFFGLT